MLFLSLNLLFLVLWMSLFKNRCFYVYVFLSKAEQFFLSSARILAELIYNYYLWDLERVMNRLAKVELDYSWLINWSY